jgi:hypothetical protein
VVAVVNDLFTIVFVSCDYTTTKISLSLYTWLLFMHEERVVFVLGQVGILIMDSDDSWECAAAQDVSPADDDWGGFAATPVSESESESSWEAAAAAAAAAAPAAAPDSCAADAADPVVDDIALPRRRRGRPSNAELALRRLEGDRSTAEHVPAAIVQAPRVPPLLLAISSSRLQLIRTSSEFGAVSPFTSLFDTVSKHLQLKSYPRWESVYLTQLTPCPARSIIASQKTIALESNLSRNTSFRVLDALGPVLYHYQSYSWWLLDKFVLENCRRDGLLEYIVRPRYDSTPMTVRSFGPSSSAAALVARCKHLNNGYAFAADLC